jgi:hypothetical protein
LDSGGGGSGANPGVSGGTPGAGGGGCAAGTGNGGNGGNGKVVIYAALGTITSATGGTHTADATYDYWTFTSSGTWTPTVTGSRNSNFLAFM